jgi:hypothetical protein
MAVALGCFAAALVLYPRLRLAGLALVLLVIELAVLSYARFVPFDAPRVMLFLLSLIGVLAAAAIALVARRAWSWALLRPAVVLGLAWLATDLATHREWRALGRVRRPEDLGPLIRLVEERRRPGEGVLLYGRSNFVYAYYRNRTPVLRPEARTSEGYPLPRLDDDPDLVVVAGPDAPGAVAAVFAGRRQVWFLGSRFREGDEQAIRRALEPHGTVVGEMRRPRALLLLVRAPG